MRKQELIWLDTAENPEGQMELTFAAYPHGRRSRLLRYSTVLLTTVPLRCSSTVFLHIQNSLLPKKD